MEALAPAAPARRNEVFDVVADCAPFDGVADHRAALGRLLALVQRGRARTRRQTAEMRRLAPPDTGTDPVTEGKIRDLLLSVEPDQLSAFKFDLEYDGDDKDLVEYVFHDVDRASVQRAIVDHLQKAPPHDGIKVLSDVDDTIYGNLIDRRYPRSPNKTPYPGVLAFYNALKDEPHRSDAGTFVHDGIAQVPITTLSARPNPIVGHLEKRSIASLIDLTRPASPGPLGLQLRPSALSGHATSSTVGTLETVFRNRLAIGLSFLSAPPQTSLNPGEQPVDLLTDILPHGQEDKIAEVKFMNFLSFASVYPEYRFVFVGDSGQADALTAQRIVESGAIEGGPRVITTFIHDLKDRSNQKRPPSPAFDRLPAHATHRSGFGEWPRRHRVPKLHRCRRHRLRAPGNADGPDHRGRTGRGHRRGTDGV